MRVIKSEHLRNAERIAEETEALAARCKAADSETPFMWGLMYVDDGRPYYAELCVGSEDQMRDEAINHNRCAEEVGETDKIAAVPLWLREGGTNALTLDVWRCDDCEHLHNYKRVECERCECSDLTHYTAVLSRAK